MMYPNEWKAWGCKYCGLHLHVQGFFEKITFGERLSTFFWHLRGHVRRECDGKSVCTTCDYEYKDETHLPCIYYTPEIRETIGRARSVAWFEDNIKQLVAKYGDEGGLATLESNLRYLKENIRQVEK